MSARARDSAGDQGPGWTPQTTPEAAECCSTCQRTAAGYKGPLHECGACYEYRRQHGSPRPQRLIDRADVRRYERAARQAELDVLLNTRWAPPPNLDEWDARRHRHGAPR